MSCKRESWKETIYYLLSLKLHPTQAYLAYGVENGPTKLHLILDTLGCRLSCSEGIRYLFHLNSFLQQLTRRSTDFHEPRMHCDIGVFWHFSEETREGVITKEGRSRVHLQPFQTLKQRFFRYCGKGRRETYNRLSKTRLDCSRQRKAGPKRTV